MKNKKLLWVLGIIIVAAVVWLVFCGQNKPLARDYMYVNASEDMIVLHDLSFTAPDTLSIAGAARGYWYFEASFPVEVQDADGVVIGQGVAQADGEWMTEEFVPFATTIQLNAPYRGAATLLLKKDNPSGETENDASLVYKLMLK